MEKKKGNLCSVTSMSKGLEWEKREENQNQLLGRVEKQDKEIDFGVKVEKKSMHRNDDVNKSQNKILVRFEMRIIWKWFYERWN